MKRITKFIWDHNNVEALWSRHKVIPEEIEEAILECDNLPATYMIRRDGDYYQIFGETGSGRLLAMVGEFVNHSELRVFHAQDMTKEQRRAFRRVK